MFEKIKTLLTPKVVYIPVYTVVQRKGNVKPEKWTPEIRQTVSTLSSHPGFIAILDRLALHRELLESKNNSTIKKDLREADYFIAGIHWLGYLQQLVDSALNVPQTRTRDAYEEEIEAHRLLDAQLERVGGE